MKIPFSEPSLGLAEMTAVTDALRAGQIGGNGAVCRRVQDQIAEITGARYALLTPSATHAMEIALLAMDVGPGDEVLMPAFAFVSQANAILARGARPVFCDVDPATLNMDPEEASRRITRRTKMLMPVHYAGVSCDIDAFRRLAREHGLRLFEDAAQCMGARSRGRHLGTIGEAGCISFHSTKNIACGEGGALLIRNKRLARAAEVIQEKGTNRSAFLRGEVEKYTWIGAGGSYVMSDLLAALLEAQLARLDEITQARVQIWERYHEGMADLEREGVLRRPFVPKNAEHNGHIYAIRLETPALRDRLLGDLRKRDIDATFHFQPLHLSPFAKRVLPGRPKPMPHTESAAKTLLRLPLFTDLKTAQVDRVIEAVREICYA